MTKSRSHTAWAGVGILLTLTLGSPAIADDVELLLSIPGSSNAAKPNILFILDSSGSMNTIETTQEPFDGTKPYSGLSQAVYNVYPIATDADMVEISGTSGTTLNIADRGWKFTLPPGQKVLSGSQTFDDSIFFVSFEAQSVSANPCQAGLSLNRLYRVDIVNGDPVVDLDSLDPNDPTAADDARVTELKQGGIAPKPTFLFPSPSDPDNCHGEECSPPPIYCVGVECGSPGFDNDPVRTLWTQDGAE